MKGTMKTGTAGIWKKSKGIYHAIKKRSIYEKGAVKWLNVWSLLLHLLFFLYITVVGILYLDDVSYRRCAYPLPVFLIATGVSHAALSSVRFVSPRRGTMALTVASSGALIAGCILLFVKLGSERVTKVQEEGFCNHTVFYITYVVVVFLSIFVFLNLLLLLVIHVVEEKPKKPPDVEDATVDKNEAGNTIQPL